MSHHRWLAAALAAGIAAPALAQDAAAVPDAPASGEIVVTARYRSETIQSVPIAITAVSGQSLAERQLNTVQDISATIPSVEFRGGASNKDRTIFIRGIGTITTSPGVEPSVSTVLDGVVLTRPGQSTLDLGEVERVEVLRGPQGTLFGKNASAGVVNIVTRNPTDEFRAFGELGATSDEEYRVKAGVSGALIPGKLQALVGGLYAKWDGNARNTVTDNEVNGFRRYGGRGKLVATPTETLKFTLIGDYLNSHDTVPTSIYINTGRIAYPSGAFTDSPDLAAALRASGIVAGGGNRRTNTDFDTDVRDKNFGVSLTADLELGDYTITSITGWRKWLNDQHQDYDSTNVFSAAFPRGEDFGHVDTRQISEELRLTSPKGGLIDYVLGAYYLHADTDETYRRNIDERLATGAVRSTAGVANYGITNDNYALFGEANVNLSTAFRLIAGYRSTWDNLDFYHVRTSTADPANVGAGGGGALDRPGIRSYHNASGKTSRRGDSYRLGAQYDLGPRAQTYVTYSRGYKGPAYNVYFNMRSQLVGTAVLPLDEIALDPETSRSWEAGIKGSTSDRSFSYSLALFTTKFSNYQANFNDVVGGAQVSRLINAGSARSRGVELDLTARPTRGLTVDFSLAHTDAEVVDFFCPPGSPSSCDINGQPLPYAPRWKAYLNGAYQFALTDALGLEVQSDLSSRSKTQFSLAETRGTIQPDFAIWNASVALSGRQDGWQLRGYVKNITNTHYANFLTNGTFAGIVRYVPRDDKRFYGLLLRKDF